MPERVAILNRLADLIEANMDELVALEVAQTGTAIKFRRDNDMPFAPDNLRFFATAIRHLDGKAAGEYSTDHTSMVRREPIGVCGQIAPWNYPFMMAIWKIGPALAAGNSVVLKPASATPLTTLRSASWRSRRACRPGVLNVVTGPGEVVGCGHRRPSGHRPRVAHGRLRDGPEDRRSWPRGNLKRVHLELGGKAPFIVYADADLDAAARGAVAGGYINAGQDCTAATRIYVQRPVYEEFLGLLKGYAESVRVGDPEDPTTDMGSLINEAQVAPRRGLRRARPGGRRARRQRRRARGRARPGGRRLLPSRPSSPTSTRTPSASSMEIFGPVLTVLPFDTEEEVLAKANDTKYGLASSVWTQRRVQVDARRAGRSTSAPCGSTTTCPSPARCPTAASSSRAIGKDMSDYSFDEYTQIKHVMIELTGEAEKGWHYQIFGDAGRSRREVAPTRSTQSSPVPPIDSSSACQLCSSARATGHLHDGPAARGLGDADAAADAGRPDRRDHERRQRLARRSAAAQPRQLRPRRAGALHAGRHRRAGGPAGSSTSTPSRERLEKAAAMLEVEPPTPLMIEGWWDQAQTLAET